MEQIKNKIKSNKKAILLTICILLLAFVIQKTLSKYVIEIEDIHVQEAPAFYFESDFASVDTANQYVINDWDGANSRQIQFNVKNYLNQLLINEQKIKYKINAAVIDENTEDGDDSTLLTLELKNADTDAIIANDESLEIVGNTLAQNNYILKMTPNGTIENDKTFKIRITITSTSPYEKELVGEINITANSIESYETNLIESSNGEYVILNIKVNEPDKDITIKYDNTKTILDKSSSTVNGLDITKGTTMDSFTIPKENLKKGNVYEIYFVKIEQTLTLGTDIICE